jgi:ubiquinol-cytochrome c reductase cytochrome b subunit
MAATDKQTNTGSGPYAGILDWFDKRFPLLDLWREHLAEYYAPKNFNFWYYFGSILLLTLALQIATGIWLTMDYKPDAERAFASIEFIMRDVPAGWWMRYMHSTGASAIFICLYAHMFRGMLYGSYRAPRELLWIIGVLIFLAMMGQAFMGYLLPWGQMSYWGAQVIVNLFSALPVIGPDLALWIRGDYVVSDATLNRFFAFHVIAVPLVLLGLVFVHLLALHRVGSNNPDGIEIKKAKNPETGIPLDGIPFHPYYTVKDLYGVSAFLTLFFAVVFFSPEMRGYFLEANNFIPADPLKTPPHFGPVWYFTPFYSILRSVTDKFMWVIAAGTVGLALLIIFSVKNSVLRAATAAIAVVLIAGYFTLDAKVWGVIVFGLSPTIFALLPWLDRSPARSIRYRGPIYKAALTLFVMAVFLLGYLGTQEVNEVRALLGQIGTTVYFAFFLLMPWYSTMDKCKPEPQRLT